jgi:hypothetical protein
MEDGMRLSEEKKQAWIELMLLKWMDLAPDEGGKVFPVELPYELDPIQPYLQELRFRGLIEVAAKPRGALGALRGKAKEEFYRLTQAGLDYLGRVIDEAEGIVNVFDDMEVDEIREEAMARGLDPLSLGLVSGRVRRSGGFPGAARHRAGRTPVGVLPHQ